MTRSNRTHVGVDVGGTFTDVVLVVDGEATLAKVPTTEADQSEGVITGIERACREAGIDPAAVDHFDHATTVSVNALLERTGAKTALLTTAGFADVLEIGRQDRPALYDLSATKPAPLVPAERRFEVGERATGEGIDRPVDEDAVRAIAHRIADADVESVAISFLHAYAQPKNERRAAAVLREELDLPVSVSHEVLPTIREYERTATTVADAYVKPTVTRYLDRLTDRASDLGLPAPRVMRSNGGVAAIDTVLERPVTTVLSGPAAGVVGAGATASVGDSATPADTPERRATDRTAPSGRTDAMGPNAITFDMGGTSTDVSVVRDGRGSITAATTIDGIPIHTPMVDISTVGAGGGSIAWVDAGGALRVGPDSAGADPGPACYPGGGSRPTVTDAAVVLGYIGAETALGGSMTLDVDAATDVLEALSMEAGLTDARAAAHGVHRVATATMTRAIRSITVERGIDPRSFDLVAFGGAGPIHATAIADELDLPRVVVPGPAGVLSAYGLLAADERHDEEQTVATTVDPAARATIDRTLDELVDRAVAATSAPSDARIDRVATCRYVGQQHEIPVAIDASNAGSERATARAAANPAVDVGALRSAFHDRHEASFGYRLDAPVELVDLRVTATVDRSRPILRSDGQTDAPLDRRPAWFSATDAGGTDTAGGLTDTDGGLTDTAGRMIDTSVFSRERLAAETVIEGPAIVEDDACTTVVAPGWTARVRRDGALVCTPAGGERT